MTIYEALLTANTRVNSGTMDGWLIDRTLLNDALLLMDNGYNLSDRFDESLVQEIKDENK